PGGSFPFLDAVEEERRLLSGHSKGTEAAIEGRLKAEAGSKQARERKLHLPFAHSRVGSDANAAHLPAGLWRRSCSSLRSNAFRHGSLRRLTFRNGSPIPRRRPAVLQSGFR